MLNIHYRYRTTQLELRKSLLFIVSVIQPLGKGKLLLESMNAAMFAAWLLVLLHEVRCVHSTSSCSVSTTNSTLSPSSASLSFLSGFGQLKHGLLVNGIPTLAGASFCTRLSFGSCGSAFLVLQQGGDGMICGGDVSGRRIEVFDVLIGQLAYNDSTAQEGDVVLNGSVSVQLASTTNRSTTCTVRIFCNPAANASISRDAVFLHATPMNNSFITVNAATGEVGYFLFLMSNSVCPGFDQQSDGSSSSSSGLMPGSTVVGSIIGGLALLVVGGLILRWRFIASQLRRHDVFSGGYGQLASSAVN